ADEAERGHEAVRGEVEVAKVQKTGIHVSIVDGRADPLGSERSPKLQDHRRTGRARIEDVGREFQLRGLVTNVAADADKEPLLDIKLGLEDLGVLGHRAKIEPFQRLKCELRPGVIKVAGLRGGVEYVLVIERKSQLLP